MEYCPECGTEARTDVTYCPGCGTDLTEYREWASSTGPESGAGATAERAGSPSNGSDGDPTPDAPDDDETATRTAADENAPTEANTGGAGGQQNRGQAGNPREQGEEPRTNQRGEPRQGQSDAPQRESGKYGNGQENRPRPRSQQGQSDDQGAGQPTSGQGRGRQGGRGANQPRGQHQGGQPQGGQPRRGAQGGRGAPSPQGGQPARGQQGSAAGGANQQWQEQGRGAPAGAGAAPAPGAVDQGPSLLNRIKALPFKQSAPVGAGLYVVSYLVAYAAFAVDVLVIHGSDHDLSASTLLPGTNVSSGNPLEMWQLVGWLLYSGQNVPIERSVGRNTEVVEVFSQGYWAQWGIPQLVTPLLYTLIPLVILAAGGLAFVRYLDGDGAATTETTETTDAALLGASVLVGYVALAVVGTFLVGASDGGTSAGPALNDTVLWTALFAGGAGAVGGVAADSLGDDAPAETASSSDAQ